MTTQNPVTASIMQQTGEKPPASRPRWYWRLLRWILLLVIVFLVVDNLILPVGMAYVATVPQPRSSGPAPDGFEAVSLTTADGITLAAWYAPPHNGAAVVLIHGAGGARENVRQHADLLAQHGYGVLSLDMRGHGESGGRTNKFGWGSTLDVGAAVTFLQEQAEVEIIGGLGSSLGGETLLGAASSYPAIRAIMADGATARSYDEFYALPSKQNLLYSLPAGILFRAVELFSGQTPPTPTILDSITQADIPLLLVAAGGNADEVAYNQLFAGAVGERATVWVAPEVGHTEALARYPAEYERRVVDFFSQTLLGG